MSTKCTKPFFRPDSIHHTVFLQTNCRVWLRIASQKLFKACIVYVESLKSEISLLDSYTIKVNSCADTQGDCLISSVYLWLPLYHLQAWSWDKAFQYWSIQKSTKQWHSWKSHCRVLWQWQCGRLHLDDLCLPFFLSRFHFHTMEAMTSEMQQHSLTVVNCSIFKASDALWCGLPYMLIVCVTYGRSM